ncbi:hypothetical protein JCM5353_007573 [Sporobolomyces roseus]
MASQQSVASLTDLSLVDSPSPIVLELLQMIKQCKKFEDQRRLTMILSKLIDARHESLELLAERWKLASSNQGAIEQMLAGGRAQELKLLNDLTAAQSDLAENEEFVEKHQGTFSIAAALCKGQEDFFKNQIRTLEAKLRKFRELLEGGSAAIEDVQASRNEIYLAQERLSRTVVDLVLEWKRNKLED